ncbi:MAG: hypothetical protein JNL62_20180 [Bryobacterales bacterium]|nr:hypothetical protein [Bryobacterales bacterium]
MPLRARLPAFCWVPATLALAVSVSVMGQELTPLWDGRELKISSRLQFLTGRSLDAVRNGRAVPFDIQLSLTRGTITAARAAERFTISYDLWEEKYSVARLSRDQSAPRQVSHLSLEDAAQWCFDNISVSTASLDPDIPYAVLVEVRAGDGRSASPLLGEPGVSLTALIEIFSRPARAQQQKWNLQAGPIRLKDAKRKPPEAK